MAAEVAPQLSRVQRGNLRRAHELAAQYARASDGRRKLIEDAVLALCRALPKNMPLPVDIGAVFACRLVRRVRSAK